MLKNHPGFKKPDSLTTPADKAKQKPRNAEKMIRNRLFIAMMYHSVLSKQLLKMAKTVASIPKPWRFRAVKEVQNFQAANSWGSSRILCFPCLGLFRIFDQGILNWFDMVWYPCPLFDKHICIMLKKSSLLENILHQVKGNSSHQLP